MRMRIAFLLATGLAAGLSTTVPAAELPDVLQRPALISTRATSSALLGIARAGKRLVAVGERGIVLLSDDHGATWRQVPVPVSVSLTAVQFVDAQRGWAVGHGGVVLATTDAGASWRLQLDGIKAARLAQQAAARADEGERLVADGPDKPFLGLYFSDAQHGFVVGAYGLAFRTLDGGQTWQPWMQRLPNPRGKHLYRIAMTGRRLYIVGEQGLLLRSDDGGDSFVATESPYVGTYFGARPLGGGGLFAFGLRGHAYASTDSTRIWDKVPLPTANSIVDCVVLSNGNLLLVDQQGQTFMSPSTARELRFQATGQNFRAPVTGLIQAADGHLVATSLAGVRRLPALPAPPNSPMP